MTVKYIIKWCIIQSLIALTTTMASASTCKELFYSHFLLTNTEASAIFHLLSHPSFSLTKNPLDDYDIPTYVPQELPEFVRGLPKAKKDSTYYSTTNSDLSALKNGDVIQLGWVLPAFLKEAPGIKLAKIFILKNPQGSRRLVAIKGHSARELQDMDSHLLAEDPFVAFPAETHFKVSFSTEDGLSVLHLSEVN